MLKHLSLLLIILSLSFSAEAKKKSRVLKKKGKPTAKLGSVEPPARNATQFFTTWLYATKSEAVAKTKALRRKKLNANIKRVKTSLNPSALVIKSFTTKEKAKDYGRQFKGLYTEVVRYKGQYWTSFGQFYEQKTLQNKKEILHGKNIKGLKHFILPRKRVSAFKVIVTESKKMDDFYLKSKKFVKSSKPTGFYLLEAAYGTEEPGHWSKFKNWFYGSLDGSRKSFDWKLSGRFFYDLAFTLESDFYSSFVEKNHQSQFIFDESYVAFDWKDIDFKLGRQHIKWGDLIGAYVADIVTARDMRDFILPRKSIRDIPQWAFLAEKHWSKTALQLFWLPFVNVDEIGVFGSDFFPLVVADFGGAIIQELGREAPEFGEMGYGTHFSYRGESWFWSWFFLSSFNREARYERVFSGPNVELRAKHFAVSKTGFTIEKQLTNYLVRFETAVSLDDKAPTSDQADIDGLIDQKVVDIALAIDANLFDDVQTQLQYVARTYLDYDPNLLVDENEQFVTAYANYKFDDAEWMAELTVHIGVQRQDSLLRPRFNWTMSPSQELSFGYDAFGGDDNGMFGRFANNDRVYTEFLWKF